MQRQKQTTVDPLGIKTPIFDLFHGHKSGTPVGGGLLVILLSTILFICSMTYITYFRGMDIQINYPSMWSEVYVLLFTFLSFGILGLYDDLSKIFGWRTSGHFGLQTMQKLAIQVGLALCVGYWLAVELQIDFIYIPFIGQFDIGYWYILFAAGVIVAFSNAVNITDGLDGLSSGVLMVTLAGFWIIARSIIDVPTSLFIAVWLGGLLAFLYFNVYPARIWLGDTGALSFGATFAVIGLILGKTFALPVIGGVFIIEVTSSALQLVSKKLRGKKIITVAPFHLYLQKKGWEEPKIVMRFWLLAILFVVSGLAIAFIR